MTPEPTDWIAISEQQPGDDQYPVWGTDETGEVDFCRHTAFLKAIGAKYWKPAQLPPPPPKPRTQREEDEEAWIAFKQGNYSVSAFMAWNAALRHRDAQNRADLEASKTIVWDETNPAGKAMLSLRKRAGL